ncbi:mannan endo-1,4-beta-mannosidase [Ranunculus cassubicifolius]
MKYRGLVFFLLLLIQHHTVFHQVNAVDGFIKTRGLQFMLNGTPFYANGFNAYWLMNLASDPSQRNKVSDGETRGLLGSLRNRDHTLTSSLSDETLLDQTPSSTPQTKPITWAFGDGGYKPLQSSPGPYNQDMFKARRYGIKLILSFVNNYENLGGRKQYAWFTEMASYVKSIDRNHLLEAGLEGFYRQTSPQRKQFNTKFRVGTDFIANNQILDFATIHSYPDQWVSSSNDQAQMSFLNNWLDTHIQDAQYMIRKPLLLAEFGKSSKDPGYSTYQRESVFHAVYNKVDVAAKSGGATAGSLFWQLLTEGMNSYGDGYEIVLSKSPSTANMIAQQSHKLLLVRKMYIRLRNSEKW